ncbi:Fic family protein, partial [Bacteroides sp. RTP21281st1_F3_RTP21281_210402]
VMSGSFDSSKGEYRLCGVTAGIGGRSYMNYQKVPAKIEELCSILQERQKAVETFREQYELSFNAHLNLATIHPWVDGNGRTARLLMNYIQFCCNLFPTKIFKEDRDAYILSLRQSQEEETNQPFLDFMAGQLKKSLSLEIERFNASQKRGVSLMF